MKGIIGLVLIIIGFVSLFWTGNDLLFHTRTYTLISKHQSEHKYKGNYHPDYYITVRYDDDTKFNWTKSVGGASYFSMTEGSRYNEREPKNNTLLLCLVFGSMLAGAILLAIYMTNLMEI